jgi:hypothetical protein
MGTAVALAEGVDFFAEIASAGEITPTNSRLADETESAFYPTRARRIARPRRKAKCDSPQAPLLHQQFFSFLRVDQNDPAAFDVHLIVDN